MACYDCEDCKYHESYGGKCTRFEYNCPFGALVKYDGEQISKFVNIIENIKKEVDELKSLDEECEIECELSSISFQLMEIKDKFNVDLLEEIYRIME